ncbi:MAG: PHP domain-containing protein [Firmicutes bacterium]|nr:PHP domain-containing protein [Bacillota bacterium]
MPVDLHIHTTASDGTESPERVVEQARAAGLQAIAVTDHDTLAGCAPAIAAGSRCGLEVIPGMELGAFHGGKEIHILGYLVDLDDGELLNKLSFLQEGRKNRMKKMVEKLQQLGYDLDVARVYAASGGGAVGRPHLAAALVETGAVETSAEAFQTLIGKGCPAYIPRYKLSPLEAIQMIRKAGGVPVLAHPGLDGAGALIGELAKGGLMGVEAFHPAHTPVQAAYYERLAKKEGLLVTGGSDYHGRGRKPDCYLGAATAPYPVLTEMKKRRVALSNFKGRRLNK